MDSQVIRFMFCKITTRNKITLKLNRIFFLLKHFKSLENAFQQCDCVSVIHTNHLEDIHLHVRRLSDSSWSLGSWHFKPQPSLCGLELCPVWARMCVCGYFKQCNKSECVAQELWLFSGMGSWYERLDVLEGFYCTRSLKSGALNSTLRNNDQTTWQFTAQRYETWTKVAPYVCLQPCFLLTVYFHRKVHSIDVISYYN